MCDRDEHQEDDAHDHRGQDRGLSHVGGYLCEYWDLPLRSAVKPDPDTDADSPAERLLSNEFVSDQSRVAAWKETRVC